MLQEASDDVRTLARLWQLQQKMQAVDGTAASYQARMGRVATAVAGIEQRLSKRLELLDGYARVMNMIEIEVEMDMQVSRRLYVAVHQLLDKKATCGLSNVFVPPMMHAWLGDNL